MSAASARSTSAPCAPTTRIATALLRLGFTRRHPAPLLHRARRLLTSASRALHPDRLRARDGLCRALARRAGAAGCRARGARSDLVRGEYGILIRSDLKGKGLGWRLMDLLITYARKEGIAELSGLVLAENTTMLGMAREFGFEIRPVPATPPLARSCSTLSGPQHHRRRVPPSNRPDAISRDR